MALTGPPLQVGLLLVSIAVTGSLAVYAYRNRAEPGAAPFAALMVSITLWAGTYAVSLLTHDPARRVLMEKVQWVPIASVPVWLLLFALAYTGHDEFLTRRTVVGLNVFPAVVVLAAATNHWHGLLWSDVRVSVSDGLAFSDPVWGPMFYMHAVFTYALVGIALALILRLVFVSDYLYADQSALLLVGVAAPATANVVDVFELYPPLAGPSVELAPYAFAITGVSFGYALFSRRLFDLVPATRQLGRNAAIGQLDDGILIVDTARRVVYCNEAAGEIIDCDPSAAVGREARDLVDESRLDFDAEDALAEIERGDRTYEIRTSPVTDRRDRAIGHTLVVHDVTARKRRERQLAAQRDELARLDDLNATIRGVNQALVSATSREEIEREVCERVLAADRYATACVADMATWSGDADRWTVAGRGAETDGAPPDVSRVARPEVDPENATDRLPAVEPDASADPGSWVVVPLAYGRTVYGALGLYAADADVSEREREVLGELGETIGLAINAVETQQLLSAETVVEVELESDDADSPLVAASTAGDGDGATLEVAGFVPGDDGDRAYVRVERGDPDAVRERLAAAATGDVRAVREEGDLLEWRVTGDALLGALSGHGVHVREARADGGRVRVEGVLASDADVRRVVDRAEEAFPDTRLVSKRERARSVEAETDRGPSEASLDDLTDRQREVIEVAYRAGYFNWPRDSTAEELAESLDISSPTLHSHLRQAEQSILSDVFEADPPERA